MLNNITIQGRFTADPMLKTTPNDVPVARFTLAVERDFPKGTDFITCVAWRKSAEFVSKWFHKGDMAVVQGRLQSRQWEDRDSKKQTSWEVQTDQIHFCGKKAENNTFDVNAFDDLGGSDSEDELPF